MIPPTTALDDLKRLRPEWLPWLAVVEEVVGETTSSRWEAAVPDRGETQHNATPVLSGATLAMDASAVRRLLGRLIRIASRSGTERLAALEPALRADVDILALFRASLCQDSKSIAGIAAASGADAEALQGVVALLALPFLHACNRRWAPSIRESWVEGYCPVCGSWPAFAEVRGIERRRYFRCGRCGGEWHAHMLHCAYCTNTNHDELAALVPDKAGAHGVIEACRRCFGYVKTFTRLQGCPPGTVMLDDLGSVDLDVAALEQGYTRPQGAGFPIEIVVSDRGAQRRFFAWNT